jgi:hypothetical protein
MSSKYTQAANLMQRRLTPYFKGWGFSQHGRVYRKTYNAGLMALATVELEGTRLAGQFNIEISIFIPEVHDYLTDYPIRKEVRNIDCCIRHRFSDLLFGYNAKWWQISSEPEFIKSFIKDFETHGMLFIDRFNSRAKIFEEYVNSNEGFGSPAKVVAAMIALGQGDQVTATRLLFEQASETDHKGHRDYVLELAQRHKLLPKLTSNEFNKTLI